MIHDTLVGVLCGWMLCVALFYWNTKTDYWKRKTHFGYDPLEWMTWPVADGFWRWMAYLTLIGGAIGLIVAALRLLFRS